MASSQDNNKAHAGCYAFHSFLAPTSPVHFPWKYNTEISFTHTQLHSKYSSHVHSDPCSHLFNVIQYHKNLIQTTGLTWTAQSASGHL